MLCCFQLVDVDDAEITKDYALTTVGLEPASATLRARMQNIPVFRDNWKGAANMGASKFVNSISLGFYPGPDWNWHREHNMTEILAMIREKYGGAAGYLTMRTSLREEDLVVIRKNLLVKV